MASKTHRRKRASPEPEPISVVPRVVPWFLTLPWLFAMTCSSTLVVYGPALHGSFIFDDFHLPFADPNAAEMPARFWIGGVRPVLMITYWANFLMSGTDTVSYHVLNVITACRHRAPGIRRSAVPVVPYRARWKPKGQIIALAGTAIFCVPSVADGIGGLHRGAFGDRFGLLFFTHGWSFSAPLRRRPSIATSVKILLLTGAAFLRKRAPSVCPPLFWLTDIFWADVRLPHSCDAGAGSIFHA